jgi:hypothetical protein
MIQADPYQPGVTDDAIPVWLQPGMQTLQAAIRRDTLISDSLALNTGPVASPRFFTSHTIDQFRPAQQLRNTNESNWLYGSFAIILLMIVLLRIFYPMQIARMLRTTVFPGKGKSDARLFEFRSDTFTLLFLMIYSTSLGLFALSALIGFKWLPASFPDQAPVFFMISAAFLILLLYKLMVIRITSAIFQTREAGRLYQDHLLLSAFVTSALIIPLVVMNAFSASLVFLISASAIIILMSVVRVIRIATLGFAVESFRYVHFILYFCTLEILPLLLIGKLIFHYLMA